MLVNLLVSNFALIKNLEINFDKGINVLSGETGSGKTLLMKALKFVLGDRADKSFIRNGEKFLKVQCVFDSVDDKVKNALFDIGIDIGDDSLIMHDLRVYYDLYNLDIDFMEEVKNYNFLKETGSHYVRYLLNEMEMNLKDNTFKIALVG